MWNLMVWSVRMIYKSEASTTMRNALREESRDFRIVFRLIDKFLCNQETNFLDKGVFSEWACLLIELYYSAI